MRSTLDFLLFDWLKVDELSRRERVAREEFAPHNRISDSEEPRLEDGRVVLPAAALSTARAYLATGMMSATLDARQRPQGRPLGAGGKDPSQPQVRIIEHADVRRRQACCWKSSRRLPRADRADRAWKRTAWRSRSTAATDIPAISPSNSTGATTAST